MTARNSSQAKLNKREAGITAEFAVSIKIVNEQRGVFRCDLSGRCEGI